MAVKRDTRSLVSEYDILAARGYMSLAEEVTSALKDGWQPLGGVCIDSENGNMFQTMVKFGDDND
jgi:hypothetical protein